uniref:histidine kinase n=1 Tax=Pedobacter sp. TaxID=1411316 RepID=UPI003D7FCCF1
MKYKGHIIIHIIFWLFLGMICMLAIISSKQKSTGYELLVHFGYYGLINISIFYINYMLLIPQLVRDRKRYSLYIISIVLLIIFMGILKTLVALLYSDIVLTYTNEVGEQVFTGLPQYILRSVFISGFFIVISALIKFAVDWFGNERVQRQLESEKKDMELQFLKSQLNPHFLFNSLNN